MIASAGAATSTVLLTTGIARAYRLADARRLEQGADRLRYGNRPAAGPVDVYVHPVADGRDGPVLGCQTPNRYVTLLLPSRVTARPTKSGSGKRSSARYRQPDSATTPSHGTVSGSIAQLVLIHPLIAVSNSA